MSHPTPNPTIVFVHGAWHGPWVWDRLRRKLPGLDARAVDLPSSGSDPDRLGDLYDDADVLRAAVAEVDGPVVVVTHSYGGMVATEALTDVPNVQQVVYLAAFVPDEGESIDSLNGHQSPIGSRSTATPTSTPTTRRACSTATAPHDRLRGPRGSSPTSPSPRSAPRSRTRRGATYRLPTC